ncbi:hypothetical protein CNMCM7691_002001 [Aspergillus felis]|uniref:Alpha-1,3-glucanase n=1 Tax=Aspergillus felis TaxID=1287682 RepID=A0A8H6QY87_9EURO|nr:hypothetical protein CNMCM7691_002001 [Aspergillus felis]
MILTYLVLMLLAVSSVVSQYPVEEQSVFAHFIVGNAAAMTPAQWESDIIEAQKAHIDGFALNIAPQDDYTDRVLQVAYDTAERVGNFSLFLSFDYLSGGPWPADRVIKTINAFKDRPAQFYFRDKPLVSTFEGVGNTGDWPNIRAATGCMFIPCWTSLGPTGILGVLDIIDGAFSWDAWPVGAQDKDTASDEEWMKALAGKPYMLPVAPWFYTNLPQWHKNWLWRGDDLWHYRWRQIMDLQPPIVQILSWNDYGETHYIGPIHEEGVPEGALRYVSGHPHDAWRTFLPHYIDAYRRNSPTCQQSSCRFSTLSKTQYPISFADKIVYWYRLNPSGSGSADGTTGNNPAMGQPAMPPQEIAQDRVFVSAFVPEPSDLYVQIGENPPTVLSAQASVINHFSVPFDGQTGCVKFAIVRDQEEKASAVGPAITNQCRQNNVDWNAYVGSSD